MDVERVKEQIHPSWQAHLLPEFEKPYMIELREFLESEINFGHVFYPPTDKTFAALQITSLNKVKAVIIGQDPYHSPRQAMGLSFSVPEGVTKPPSLRNIFQELHDDLDYTVPESGNLTPWTKNVLLLNTTLTVSAGRAGSHQGKGWEEFTDRIIQVINDKCEGVVFIVWGRHAEKKVHWIDRDRHKILRSPHPSPFSAYKGFFGSKPFSQTNSYLASKGQKSIDWCLAPKD
jgi:uracil-DNA glycosylase